MNSLLSKIMEDDRVQANVVMAESVMAQLYTAMEPIIERGVASGKITSNIYDEAGAFSLARSIVQIGLAKLGPQEQMKKPRFVRGRRQMY